MENKKITYLVPFDAMGGVEVAAKELLDISSKNFTFNIEYVFNNKFEVFYPFKLLKSVRRVIKSRPNILILSLWRAVIVGLLVKLFLPKVRLVLFIHSEKDTHIIDFLLTRIGLFLSLEVWGDSVSSINKRFNLLLKIKKIKKIKNISFNLEKINRVAFGDINPNFIFWGRLSEEKNIGRSLIIFSNILKFYPDAVYKIIGPDCGELEKLKQLCVEFKINNSVLFFRQMDFTSIQKHAKGASFYLQTSLFEGAFECGLINGELNENINTKPNTSYSVAKDSLRKSLELLTKDSNVTFKWLRVFSVFGKGQHPKTLFGLLDTAILEKKTTFKMSGGEQLRDYIDIEDLAIMITRVSLQNKINGVINCCSGTPVSIRKLVEQYLVQRNVEMELDLGFYPYPEYEPMAYWGSVEKLNTVITSVYD